jgi:bacterial/archaeal transporter family-2 protein
VKAGTRAIALVLTLGAGGLLAWQSDVNSRLADEAQSWLLAALVSFTVGLCALSVIVAVRSGGRRALGELSTALRQRSLSWWTMAAGLLSAAYVVVQAGTVSTLGVAIFSLAVICGMNGGSIVADRFGAGPGRAIPISPRRVWALAVSLLAAGLAVFPYLGDESPPVLLVALVLGAGVGAAIQLAMTARVSEASGDSAVAAWFLFLVAALFLLVLSLVQGSLGSEDLQLLGSTVASSPWLLVGGLLGAAIVVINAYVVPRSGVLVFSLTLIAGQLITALVIDVAAGSLTNVWFVGGACVLMLLATAISAGARPTFRRASVGAVLR